MKEVVSCRSSLSKFCNCSADLHCTTPAKGRWDLGGLLRKPHRYLPSLHKYLSTMWGRLGFGNPGSADVPFEKRKESNWLHH